MSTGSSAAYGAAGREHGYFATEQDAEIFEHELKHALIHQIFSFNSPVWFNVGTTSPQQVSACQPYHAPVSTPAGPVPIGSLVESDAVGAKVYDAHGTTRIVATKANGDQGSTAAAHDRRPRARGHRRSPGVAGYRH